MADSKWQMAEVHQPSALSHLLSRFRRDRLTVTGAVMIALFVTLAIAAPLLAPHDPTEVNPVHRLEGASVQYPLGTDNLGRDILSRLLFGSQWSLGTAALATALIMTIGVFIGALSGYYGGWLDE